MSHVASRLSAARRMHPLTRLSYLACIWCTQLSGIDMLTLAKFSNVRQYVSYLGPTEIRQLGVSHATGRVLRCCHCS